MLVLNSCTKFQWIVMQSRLDIEQTRLLVLNAAHQLDLYGNKVAKGAIAMAKVKHNSLSVLFVRLLDIRYFLSSCVLISTLLNLA